MSYKSIFSAVTEESQVASLSMGASAIALAHDAHLDMLCLGIDYTAISVYEVGTNALILQEARERAQAAARLLHSAAESSLSQPVLRFDVLTGVTSSADLTRPVARIARFADLAVLPVPGGNRVTKTLIEACLFDARCPVLLVPDTGSVSLPPKRVVLGWNESFEALRAARAALPLLKQAEMVHIAVIDPPEHGPDRSDPGGQLAQMLARHGVQCDISVMAKTGPRVGDTLAQVTIDKDADLLVMGAYGHSRLREALLGGATQHILETAQLPVFLAH